MRIEVCLDKNKISNVAPIMRIGLLTYIDIINFNNHPYTDSIDIVFNFVDYFKYNEDFLTLYFKHKHNVEINGFNGILKIDKSLILYKPMLMVVRDNE